MTRASNGVVGLFFRRSLHENGKLNNFIKIGDVKAPIREAGRPELVPIGYADKNAPPAIVHALKWLLQKDALKQDVFLIGVPGTLRSSVVLAYLELCNREFEYLAVTRDTTEADIKQRREIRDGSALYSDLCAVRAALNGRVLVIDGVEKAERNVLPILNNLLENREMQLDDGRFLMAADKYDKLREKYSDTELAKMKLERVSENFHVIALGIPVPTFKGHTLDPPLRSRFQCRNMMELPFATMSQLCNFFAPHVSRDKLNNLLALVYGLNSQKFEAGSSIALPLFPTDMLVKAVRIWNQNPTAPEEKILKLCYPTDTILSAETQKPLLNEFLTKFECTPESTKVPSNRLTQVSLIPSKNSANVEANYSNNLTTFSAPAGSIADGTGPATRHTYISTSAHEALIADMALSHSVADFALLGARGAGKTTLICELAHRFGYPLETVVLYQDMSSRELIQTRRMLPNGDTIWEDSQLVRAAKQGTMCVLDGIEKIHWSTAEMLSSLIHHRYLQLPDGTRLIGALHFDALKARTGDSDNVLAEKGIFKIGDNFRLVALGDSESANGTRWLNEQLLSLFVFHSLKPMSIKEQSEIILNLVPGADANVVESLIRLVERLQSSPDAGVRGVAASLSLRRLVYIMRRHTQNPNEGIHDAIHRATLARFMPGITRAAFEKALNEEGIASDAKTFLDSSEHDGWQQRLSHADKTAAGNESMVPDIVFFDNKQHLKIMNDMAKDFELGSHLLVIGNQGVGKNKITDRFLQLIQRPRQYMQLHRDTTVQSLTVQSTVVDGLLKHEDSPLVKAVREGLVLVVDEADKAPLYVVAVLKSLLDSGVLYLSDGRRIQPADMPVDATIEAIPIHPDFRLIMLANRPGFPFLGNDLFAVLGDLFSVHVVDNPSRASELSMLRQYGPDVPQDQLDQLVGAFDELRSLSDGGLLNYPYSTRELVNIVKHLQLFPTDPLAVVVKNVFDFDLYSAEAIRAIEAVFHKHGIPIGITDPEKRVYLSKQYDLKEIRKLGTWGVIPNVKPAVIDMQVAPVNAQSERPLQRISRDVEAQRPRQTSFNEQAWAWKLPISEANICSDILDLGPSGFAVATVNPAAIWVVRDAIRGDAFEIELHADLYKYNKGDFRPRIHLANWPNGFNNAILVHEELSNSTFIVDMKKNAIQRLDLDGEKSRFENVLNKIAPVNSIGPNHWRLIRDNERPVLFHKGSNVIKILLPGDLPAAVETLTLPEGIKLQNVLPVSKSRYLLTVENKPPSLLTFESDGRVLLRAIQTDSDVPTDFNLLQRIGQETSEQQFALASDEFYAVKSKNFPDSLSQSELHGWRRPLDGADRVDPNPPYRGLLTMHELAHPQKESVAFKNGLLARSVANWEAPSKALPTGVDPRAISGFLEVVDTKKGTVQYVPVPQVDQKSYYHGSWIASISRPPFTIAKAADDKSLLTCDTGGVVRQWQVHEIQVMKSLQEWHKLFESEDANARIDYERDADKVDMSKLDDPKIGKIDPDNKPHVGGNQWMGGTGGYNTAGLGGVGGPYRLDAGHDVHQIHESAKQQVSDEYLKKARAINRAEYQKRLKEIDMSEHDATQYEAIRGKIDSYVTRMKAVIDSLEAREQERQWMKHQTSGDLDDGKLIEGMTGEKAIFRRRMDQPPEPGTMQSKPKRLRLVFDVSGSMYRFNGHDRRLIRSMEAAMMVMDALDGKSEKIKYDIVGHSGDGPEHVFTTALTPPTNEKQKFDVVRKMYLQSQFCLSGDFTVEALEQAVAAVAKESDVDERFVVILSDANLDRYGISPRHLTRVIESEPNVNAFVILIGSLGQQAERLVHGLPAGKAFYAADTSQLPTIIQNIFASTLIK